MHVYSADDNFNANHSEIYCRNDIFVVRNIAIIGSAMEEIETAAFTPSATAIYGIEMGISSRNQPKR
jgi:1,2-phenylacetyl-CoA epoxidase PaaB subunit